MDPALTLSAAPMLSSGPESVRARAPGAGELGSEAELVSTLVSELAAQANAEPADLFGVVEHGLARLPGVVSARVGPAGDAKPDPNGPAVSLPVSRGDRVYATLRLNLTEGTNVPAIAALAETVTKTLALCLDARDQRERRLEAERKLQRATRAIVHDFRSQLTSVIGFAHLALEDRGGELSDAQREHLTQSLEAADLLRNALDELSRFVRLAEVAPAVTLEEVNVADVLGSAVDGFGRRLPVRLECSVAPQVARIVSDASCLRLVFQSLLAQAFAISPERGRVMVGCRPTADGGFEGLVTDFGPPLTEEQRRVALEPFALRRARAERPIRPSWTALAWPLALRFVEALGGSMVIESAPETGTTARFVLPPQRR